MRSIIKKNSTDNNCTDRHADHNFYHTLRCVASVRRRRNFYVDRYRTKIIKSWIIDKSVDNSHLESIRLVIGGKRRGSAFSVGVN